MILCGSRVKDYLDDHFLSFVIEWPSWVFNFVLYS